MSETGIFVGQYAKVTLILSNELCRDYFECLINFKSEHSLCLVFPIAWYLG